MRPVELFREIPAGRAPEVTFHVPGPVAVSCLLNAWVKAATPSAPCRCTIVRPGMILNVNSRCAFETGVRHHDCDGGSSSLSSTQTEKSPACVGVPETSPFVARFRPGGIV